MTMRMSIPHTLSLLLLMVFTVTSYGTTVKDLKYGTILFDYYQQDYFSALIGYEYAKEKNELKHHGDEARLLKGGMTLSYGLADDAQIIFNDLLNDNVPEDVRNRAWFYLAKLYYQKADPQEASISLGKIAGKIPAEVHEEFNYLATLINIRNQHLDAAAEGINLTAKGTAFEPYLLFNLAVTLVQQNRKAEAMAYLNRVVSYSKTNLAEEYAVLADRAKHAMAHLAIQDKDLVSAWTYLQGVRTTGLYSNRALLTYGWTAINLNRYAEAIPALQILNKRSIAIAEVQEAKVLLAHLYEKQGAKRKALKNYLLSEKEFKEGVKAIDSARDVISRQDIPEEFVINLEAMIDETDWYGTEATLDYEKLTPFLIELMSSNKFHSVIKELRDLYSVRRNLDYWARQATEHQLIIKHRQQGWTSNSLAKFVKKSEAQKEQLEDDISELRLHTMTLDEKQQERFSALLESTKRDFEFLDDRLAKVKRIKKPYQQSEENIRRARALHKTIKQKLNVTNNLITSLEVVMRKVVNAELDKHEERMKYYWAQARLGKARLYDSALTNLEDSEPQENGETP